MSDKSISMESCPVCFANFSRNEIEVHVNKCIFLHTENATEVVSSSQTNNKSKRTRSPTPTSQLVTSPTLSSPTKRIKSNKDGTLNKFFHGKSNNSNAEDKKSIENNLDKLLTCLKESIPDEDREDLVESKVKKLSANVPLATQVQPKYLSQYFGQNHVLGEDTFLRKLLENGEIQNMILWGPPGCGKTSLSAVIKEICRNNPKQLRFTSLCAATAGIKEVQSIVSLAKAELKFKRKTVLFMDEIHRFNKRQQDVFLLPVESGDIILIGATTENPSFMINSALLSRCRVIVMDKLKSNDLLAILKNAVKQIGMQLVSLKDDPFVSLKPNCPAIEEEAIIWLADISDGDARIALGNLELVMQHENYSKTLVTLDDIKDKIKKSHMLYDRKGEEHYNIISAMHKSIRGSDPNAALYWTTRMIVSGEDPLFVARRLVRAASEDIGNADPNALQLAISTMQGCQLLGMPECDVLLAQCAIYLARAPKSREADTALAKAKRLIADTKGVQPAVPMHIRNAPTKLMRDLGYGKVADGTTRTFMPPEFKNVDFFQ